MFKKIRKLLRKNNKEQEKNNPHDVTSFYMKDNRISSILSFYPERQELFESICEKLLLMSKKSEIPFPFPKIIEKGYNISQLVGNLVEYVKPHALDFLDKTNIDIIFNTKVNDNAIDGDYNNYAIIPLVVSAIPENVFKSINYSYIKENKFESTEDFIFHLGEVVYDSILDSERKKYKRIISTGNTNPEEEDVKKSFSYNFSIATMYGPQMHNIEKIKGYPFVVLTNINKKADKKIPARKKRIDDLVLFFKNKCILNEIEYSEKFIDIMIKEYNKSCKKSNISNYVHKDKKILIPYRDSNCIYTNKTMLTSLRKNFTIRDRYITHYISKK